MRLASILIAISLLPLSMLGAEDAPYSRVPFDLKAELGDEAPGVAADAKHIAFADQGTIHVIDARTFKDTPLPLPENVTRGDTNVQVLGIIDDTVYGSVFAYSDRSRPKPGDAVARIRAGPEPGQYEIFALSLDGKYRKLFALPQDAMIAETMLDNWIVFALDDSLTLKPVNGAVPEIMLPLNDKPQRRPCVNGGEIFGLCNGGAYWCTQQQNDLKRLAYAGTPLLPLSNRQGVAVKNGDLILMSAGATIACDLTGKEIWNQPLEGIIATGGDGEICIVDGNFAAALARDDGRVLWQRYLSPLQFGSGMNQCYGSAIVSGRLVIPAEHTVAVMDSKTGELTASFPFERKLARGSYNTHATLMKFAGTGRTAVVGFERSVYGIDLTPASKVPAERQSADIANGLSLLTELEANPQKINRDTLKVLGNKLAGTPDLAAQAMPLLKGMLGDGEVLMAWQWCREKTVVDALLEAYKTSNKNDNNSFELLTMIALLPDRNKAEAALQTIVNDPGARIAHRDYAARQLRGMKPPVKLPDADRKLLYGTDTSAAVAEFRTRLAAPDAPRRQSALELLKLAPDDVIAAVAAEPGPSADPGQRAALRELGAKARERIALIGAAQETLKK